MGYRKTFLCCTLALAAWPAQARPVAYPDGWMVMGMHDYIRDTATVMYSPTAKDAVGIRTDFMRDREEWFHTATYNRLLKRWNTADSQANIFALSGAGVAQHGDRSNAAALLGMEADWETRRLYTAYENMWMYAGPVSRSYWQRGRVGVAPYAGGYKDVNTWLMLQVDHRPAEKHNVVVTPMVRLFTHQVLGELGISHTGKVMVNITTQF
ncbi:MAG: hypothetical protein EBV03_05105 [Proteobacteria bacterium]|nr:hypothetical protein [Pseudomonadota bacterium]